METAARLSRHGTLVSVAGREALEAEPTGFGTHTSLA